MSRQFKIDSTEVDKSHSQQKKQSQKICKQLLRATLWILFWLTIVHSLIQCVPFSDLFRLIEGFWRVRSSVCLAYCSFFPFLLWCPVRLSNNLQHNSEKPRACQNILPIQTSLDWLPILGSPSTVCALFSGFNLRSNCASGPRVIGMWTVFPLILHLPGKRLEERARSSAREFVHFCCSSLNCIEGRPCRVN